MCAVKRLSSVSCLGAYRALGFCQGGAAVAQFEYSDQATASSDMTEERDAGSFRVATK